VRVTRPKRGSSRGLRGIELERSEGGGAAGLGVDHARAGRLEEEHPDAREEPLGAAALRVELLRRAEILLSFIVPIGLVGPEGTF
jgi:hypothetical protein